MPEVIASETQSEFGSAHLFTKSLMYGLFDATAPGMTPELSLARAKYAAKAINEHAALVAENAALRRALGQKASPPLSNIEFQAACGKYLVDPGLALESKEVLAAIKAGSLTALRSALVNEF